MKYSRRGFAGHMRTALVALPVLSVLKAPFAWAKEVVYKAADLAVTKKNPSIAALKYVPDASKSPDRKTAKGGVPADKQTCTNCNFYKEPGVLEGKAKEPAGKCLMLANQVVRGSGWCTVWSKKV